ncbi:Arm DNA-binding domain-containing protein [Shewanella indica]|uniref:Arm DNA-binding domain-containing protein n=1 Tax=Shewanella indica TaxID=768528 RepID=UPI003999A462
MVNTAIIYDVRYQIKVMLMSMRLGKGTKMLATPKNLATAKTTLKKMNAEIDLGCFQYRDYFP